MSNLGHNSEAEIIRCINSKLEEFIKSEQKFEKLQEELDTKKEDEQEPILLDLGASLFEGKKFTEDPKCGVKGDNPDARFNAWVLSNFPNLRDTLSVDDQKSVIWSAKYREDYWDIKERYPRAKTIRGRHAKWKQEQNAKKKPDEDDTDDDVVDNDDTTEATMSISDAEKAILQFNSLSDEEKIKQLGGRPGVIDQKELDEKLESDYNPLNSASAVLVSLNRLRIYGGKKEIERNIMQVLSQSSRMKPYEAQALVLLGEIILEKRDELESMYSNTTDLNKLN